MNALRLEADESASKNEELKAKVKSLEQENLAKEQEITSLKHKNQLLESELEKIEGGLKDAKAAVDESAQHGTQNESLQRRLQLLEEEAEEADRNLRETNDKYVSTTYTRSTRLLTCYPQAPPDRRQGRPLRAQGASPGGRPRSMGGQVRGDGHQVQHDQEGARRLCRRDWQHLSHVFSSSLHPFTAASFSYLPVDFSCRRFFTLGCQHGRHHRYVENESILRAFFSELVTLSKETYHLPYTRYHHFAELMEASSLTCLNKMLIWVSCVLLKRIVVRPSLFRPGLLRSGVLCLLLVARLFSLALALISELLLLGLALGIHLLAF